MHRLATSYNPCRLLLSKYPARLVQGLGTSQRGNVCGTSYCIWIRDVCVTQITVMSRNVGIRDTNSVYRIKVPRYQLMLVYSNRNARGLLAIRKNRNMPTSLSRNFPAGNTKQIAEAKIVRILSCIGKISLAISASTLNTRNLTGYTYLLYFRRYFQWCKFRRL